MCLKRKGEATRFGYVAAEATPPHATLEKQTHAPIGDRGGGGGVGSGGRGRRYWAWPWIVWPHPKTEVGNDNKVVYEIMYGGRSSFITDPRSSRLLDSDIRIVATVTPNNP